MSRLKNVLLLSLISLSLFSCSQKSINIEEANTIINNIEHKLTDSTFKFPTKITINKLIKKNNSYIDKLSIRFSLDDLFLYYSNGFDEKFMNEHWRYVDKDENKIYHLTSITTNNKSIKYYEVFDFNKDDNFFTQNYSSLKDLIIDECSNFKETLDDCKTVSEDDDDFSKLKISSFNSKSIELNASINLNSSKVVASQAFENYLPKTSNIYKVNEDKEEKNFETKYYYNAVNITRPNIHNFILKK